MADSLKATAQPIDLRRLAKLSRIHLEDDELERLGPQFEGILNLIRQLQAVDTRGVEPLAHAFDLGLRLREDEVTATDQRERFLAQAPESEAGLFLVPQVIE